MTIVNSKMQTTMRILALKSMPRTANAPTAAKMNSENTHQEMSIPSWPLNVFCAKKPNTPAIEMTTHR